MDLKTVTTATARRGLAEGAAVLVVLGVLAAWWTVPLTEDALFWWVPKGLLAAQDGLQLSYSGELPATMQAGLTQATTPPQWAGGLPDYAHPPVWYWWLGAHLFALGPTLTAVRWASVVPAVAAAVGFVQLARRLGHPLAGVGVWALPPVLAQLLRPELDLGLLALTPWALIAVIDRQWGIFAAFAGLATAVKEPGVLLCVPAVWTVVAHRQWRALPAAFTPLVVLLAWGLLHGGLAGAERLPASVGAWAIDDLPLALQLVTLHQGRGLLLVGLVSVVVHPRLRRRAGLLPALALAVGWTAFFSVVGFRLQPHNPEPLTHVRYFVPGLAVLAVVATARFPPLALAGLLFMHTRSPFGPEASLYGADAARAEAAASRWIPTQDTDDHAIFVGSYHAAALSQPWAGHLPTPAVDFSMYSAADDGTKRADNGDHVIFTATGEPGGPWHRAFELQGVTAWRSHDATVTVGAVVGPAR